MNTTLRFANKRDDDDQHAPMEAIVPVQTSNVGNQPVAEDASLRASDLSGIAQELQSIVRLELRKIMEVFKLFTMYACYKIKKIMQNLCHLNLCMGSVLVTECTILWYIQNVHSF
jgi:hypothetical protein